MTILCAQSVIHYRGRFIASFILCLILELRIGGASFQDKVMMGNETPALHMRTTKNDAMETSYACIEYSPINFEMMDIFLVLPMGPASVEHSFSRLKMFKKKTTQLPFRQ